MKLSGQERLPWQLGDLCLVKLWKQLGSKYLSKESAGSSGQSVVCQQWEHCAEGRGMLLTRLYGSSRGIPAGAPAICFCEDWREPAMVLSVPWSYASPGCSLLLFRTASITDLSGQNWEMYMFSGPTYNFRRCSWLTTSSNFIPELFPNLLYLSHLHFVLRTQLTLFSQSALSMTSYQYPDYHNALHLACDGSKREISLVEKLAICSHSRWCDSKYCLVTLWPQARK